jgi:hypothetical protein
MESTQDQLNGIVGDFEQRLSDLRDAQQTLIRQLETDKVVLKAQMDERSAQLERERGEIATHRRQVEAEHAELSRVWAVVRELTDVIAQRPKPIALDTVGQIGPASHDPADASSATHAPQSGEDESAPEGEDWSVRHAA